MRAMKAMRLTAMLAMSEIDCVAPFDAASMMFLSCLKNLVILDKIMLINCLHTDILLVFAYINREIIQQFIKKRQYSRIG